MWSMIDCRRCCTHRRCFPAVRSVRCKTKGQQQQQEEHKLHSSARVCLRDEPFCTLDGFLRPAVRLQIHNQSHRDIEEEREKGNYSAGCSDRTCAALNSGP